jgi:hypothetical protein
MFAEQQAFKKPTFDQSSITLLKLLLSEALSAEFLDRPLAPGLSQRCISLEVNPEAGPEAGKLGSRERRRRKAKARFQPRSEPRVEDSKLCHSVHVANISSTNCSEQAPCFDPSLSQHVDNSREDNMSVTAYR